MNKLLSAYLWGYKNYEAAYHSFRKFKEFYPNGDISISVDYGGDYKNYKEVADGYNADITLNPFQIGYPGNHQDHDVGRECWPRENSILWCDNLTEACKNTDSKYLIVLEEDTFILKPISILEQDFGISVFEYNASALPPSLIYVVEQFGGNSNIPNNIFGRKGYGAGGGFIINREAWIDSWTRFKPFLELNYDEIVKHSKLIGWSDCLAQIVIMAGGYTVVQNPNHVQTWYHERPDLYPKYTNWEDYEIVDYIKDINVIREL